eukprot:gene6092-5947_t
MLWYAYRPMLPLQELHGVGVRSIFRLARWVVNLYGIARLYGHGAGTEASPGKRRTQLVFHTSFAVYFL